MRKIIASQVKVGMHLSCDVYNEKGVLLWTAGSRIKNDRQASKLSKEGYRSDLQEWVPPSANRKASTDASDKKAINVKKSYSYHTVLDALLEIQLPMIYIFDVFKSDSFTKEKQDLTHQIKAVVDVILDVCEKHPDETIATIHMFHQGKLSLLSATYNCALTALLCRTLKLSEEEIRIFASAALTSNGSIVKLQDSLICQKTGITVSQKELLENHPYESLILLTRAGVRDDRWLDSVLMHHEYMDGSGYPRGLSGEDIYIGARILCVADAYIKLILPRKSIEPPTALKTVYKRYTKRLDKKVVMALVKLFGVVPPGSMVELKEGGVGIVIKHSKDPSKPLITKVGDKITNYYSEFNLTSQFGIAGSIRKPDEIPKKLFKLWNIYRKSRRSVLEIEKEEKIKRKK